MTTTKATNIILHGDCLTEMRKLESGSIDLIVTSPPYNLKRTTGGGIKNGGHKAKWKVNQLKEGYADHADNMPHAEYVEWQRACLTEMMRLIPEDGAIFYNHKNRVQAGVLQDRSDILSGFPVRQIITWDRGSGFNFNDAFFLPTTEQIYLIAKSKFKLVKGANRFTDVWRIPPERDNSHPAPFPVEIALRCISSTNAKIVLDPFFGSGTVGVAARELGRRWIGIELSAEYIKLAEERLPISGAETLTRLKEEYASLAPYVEE